MLDAAPENVRFPLPEHPRLRPVEAFPIQDRSAPGRRSVSLRHSPGPSTTPSVFSDAAVPVWMLLDCHRTMRELASACRVNLLGSTPPPRRPSHRTLRAGLFWTALGLGATTISYALTLAVAARSPGFDRRFAELFFAPSPVPPLALGIHGLALALRLRATSALADRTAAYLSDHLPEGYVVVPHYLPRDGADEEVPMVVIGPPGVVVIEPRDEGGEVLCYEDNWYRRQKHGVARRFQGQSPSVRARWNALRVRGDIAVDPARTPVEAVVVFTGAHIAEVTRSSVPAVEGLPAIVDRLVGTPHGPMRVAV